jgi:hypothetical protein
MSATAKSLDFTNVKEGGEFNKKHQTPGDYRAKIMGVKDAPTKENNEPQWCFTIKVGSGTYPYYCKLVENQLWKIRNIFVAAGKTVPKKKVKVDPQIVVGKEIAVTLGDDEYKDRLQSNIESVFPLSELGDSGDPHADDDDDPEDDEDETEVEETPKAKKDKGKKKKGKVLEELDIEDM